VTFSFRPLSLAEAHRRRSMRVEPHPFSSRPVLLHDAERDENVTRAQDRR
jgi:hypothetical protein